MRGPRSLIRILVVYCEDREDWMQVSPGSSCIPVLLSHHTDMFPVNQTHSNSITSSSENTARSREISVKCGGITAET